MKVVHVPSFTTLPGRRGFSLVEVSIATGIAALSIIMLFGLLPSGLNLFRQAMNVTVSSQIAQRLIYEAVQTDYDTLVNGSTTAFTKAPRYFDNEGVETSTASDAIYHVYTRIVPSTILPPSTTGNSSLATVTIQVLANPNNQTFPAPSQSTNFLIEPPNTMTCQTYTSHIAKIK